MKRANRVQRPTIRDLASLAGVSQSTASRAISGQGYVSEQARSEVERASERLGYVPNGVARSLRARATGVIGVLISDLSNPFYAEVANGVELVLRGRGYRMMLANSDGLAQEETSAIRMFQAMRVDGVILTPSDPMAGAVQRLIRDGIAVVEVDRVTADAACDAVVVENEQGAYQATRHLLELGHRRIGLVIGETNYTTGLGRLEGYRDALNDAMIACDESLIAYTSFDPPDGAAIIRGLLSANPDITSLFATNNVLAQCAVRALQQLGLKVPRDLSLIAFDDLPWMEFASPAITTIAQPTLEIGREAATLLLDRLSGGLLGPPVVRRLPTRFVRRESTGPVRRRPEGTYKS